MNWIDFGRKLISLGLPERKTAADFDSPQIAHFSRTNPFHELQKSPSLLRFLRAAP
jgi:hypothetical protein